MWRERRKGRKEGERNSTSVFVTKALPLKVNEEKSRRSVMLDEKKVKIRKKGLKPSLAYEDLRS